MNQLRYLAEFHRCLDDYSLSQPAIKKIAGLTMVLLIGPSSSGRNTIIRELLKTGEYHFIISDTTRQPRINDGVLERHGVDYWFRTEEEVLADIQNGEFLEAAIIHNQQVSGISIRELEKARKDGKVAINDVDIVGAANIYRAKPDTSIVFVVSPDFETWIGRLRGRGELPEAEIRRRLETAAEEFAAALEETYYTFVINDKLEDTVAKIYQIARYGTIDAADQEHGRAKVEVLLRDTLAYLAQKHN